MKFIKCIKTVVMDSQSMSEENGKIAFIKGKVYKLEGEDSCDEQGIINHTVSPDSDWFEEHFKYVQRPMPTTCKECPVYCVCAKSVPILCGDKWCKKAWKAIFKYFEE